MPQPVHADIPRIDFSPFLKPAGVNVPGEAPTLAQLAVASQIDSACRAHGFIHLVNCGICAELRDASFGAAQDLFSLEDAAKRTQLAQITPETNTGYLPMGLESLNKGRAADKKEAFNVRSDAVQKNDYSGCPPSFVGTAPKLWDAIELFSQRYAAACALGLGLEPSFFVEKMRRMDLCTLRFLHYPPCDFDPAEQAAGGLRPALRVSEHTDFGLFTLLLLKEGPLGLQIMPVEGGEIGGDAGGEDACGWQDLALPQDGEGEVSAVVNTGALMARWTNDVWRATAHRVVVPSAEVAAGHRYSIACFFDPDKDAVVEVHDKFVPEGGAPKYGPTTGLEYVLKKLNEAQGKA